jgi:hypothetical protein
MGNGLSAISFALVTLKVPLCKKLLCLVSNFASISIGEDLLLVLINYVPPGADINATCDADLLAG